MWTRIKLAIVLTVLGVGQAFAQGSAYPNKPLRWLIPFAPAGGTDLVARPIAQRLGDRLGQSILIDNRGGGGGVIAAEIVARAVPDGYTLLVGAVAVMTVNVSLMKLPFDPVRDFAPITKFAAVPNMLAVRAALPARTLQELVEYAKGNPRKVTWAMSGIGSPGSLGGELFARQANISVVNVIYKGAGPAVLSLLGNESDVLLANPSVFMPHLKTGRVRALAVASSKRLTVLPDMPTFGESGYPGFESVAWYGLLAPARTPAAVINFLHAETVKVLNQPDLVAHLALDGTYVIGNTPQQFGQEIRDEIGKWARVIKDAGIKL
jgi:tripartite-type tricarboxylate transporter receptor subunit TctC